MKNLNRWVYAIIGVITLLLAGLVYAWSVMSKSIGASRPDWTAAQLSMTFTMVMAFFCIGCLIAGMMAKKVSPKIYIILSGILFLAGFMLLPQQVLHRQHCILVSVSCVVLVQDSLIMQL